jgi:hypothetical protein
MRDEVEEWRAKLVETAAECDDHLLERYFAQVLSKEEIQARYGDAPNVHLECGECMLQYETDMQTACPEWDKECRLKE